MLVTDRARCGGRALPDVVREAVAAGLRLVHLREPDLSPEERRRLAVALLAVLGAGGELLVGRDAALARGLGRPLHLPAAAPLPDLTGIPAHGRSAHGPAEFARARDEGAAWGIVGTIYATASKPGRVPGGPALVAAAVAAAPGVRWYAIGGIEPSGVAAVMGAGAHGVAVSGAILAAPDPGASTLRLLAAIEEAPALH